MKITVRKVKRTPITSSYKEGLVAIWWYTDDGEFWDFAKSLDDAEDDHGYLQYSLTKNHLNLWRTAVIKNVVDPELQTEIINRGYKSIERGRVVFNIRSQCYEVICSQALVNDTDFRDACIKQFNLSGNRVDFIAMNHYRKEQLTGNPALDSYYFDY